MTTVAVVVGGMGVVITVLRVCECLDEETPTTIPIMMQMTMGTTTNNTN